MPTRADNGEGSCKQVLNGKHKGKWRVQHINRDELGRPTRVSRLFTKQAEAKDFLRGLKREDSSSIVRLGRAIALGEWFDWLADNDWPEELSERTISDRQARFRKYVRNTWGDVPLTRIDPLRVRVFYRELKRGGVGQHTILAIKRDLVRVFDQASDPYQRVPATLANPFRLTMQAAPPRSAVALTPEQACEALASPKLRLEQRAMLALFLLTGVRISEQMALTKEQLLFDQNLLFIDRAVKFGKNNRQFTGLPKGDKKRFTVMCPTLKSLLLELTQDMRADQFIWSAATENKPRMKKLVYATWRTIIRDAELPGDMSPHDCRLTFINWVEKLLPEVSPTTLKESVGHANQGVTQIHYTRPITPAQDLLRQGIERLLLKTS